MESVEQRFTDIEFAASRGSAVLAGGASVGAAYAPISAAMAKKLATVGATKAGGKIAAKSAAGMLAGSATGAAAGSFIPGLGTAIGGVLGGIAGWFAVDMLVVEMDERVNRHEFEAKLRKVVSEQETKAVDRLKGLVEQYIADVSGKSPNELVNPR